MATPLADRGQSPQATNQATSVLEQDDLFDILSLLTPIETRWRELGNALRLNSSNLDSIHATDGANLARCLNRVIDQWLRKNYNVKKFGEPSWARLAEAVRHNAGGNHSALADEILRIHAPQLLPDPGENPQPKPGGSIYNMGDPSQLLSYNWFHGQIPREVAEERLSGVGSSCFLIRASGQHKGSLSISLKDEHGTMFHYLINRGPGWYEIQGTYNQRQSVPDLVAYYKTRSISADHDHKLSVPCPKGADSATGGNVTDDSTTLTGSDSGDTQAEQSLPTISSPKLTWRRLPDMPIAMSHPQVVRIGNKIYVGGGYTKDESTAKLILIYNIKKSKWSKHTIKCSTIEFGLSHLHGKLVVAGGVEDEADNNSPTNDVLTYNESKKKWVKHIPPFTTPRFYATAFSDDSNLAVAGGGLKMNGDAFVSTPVVEVYQSATNKWHFAKELPLPKSSPGSPISLYASGNSAYLLHYNTCMSVSISSLVSSKSSSSSTHQHSQSSKEQSISPWKVTPCPLKCSAITQINEAIVTIGGRKDGRIRKTAHMYQPETNSWALMEGSDLPETRYYAGVTQTERGEIVIIGGEELVESSNPVHSVFIASVSH